MITKLRINAMALMGCIKCSTINNKLPTYVHGITNRTVRFTFSNKVIWHWHKSTCYLCWKSFMFPQISWVLLSFSLRWRFAQFSHNGSGPSHVLQKCVAGMGRPSVLQISHSICFADLFLLKHSKYNDVIVLNFIRKLLENDLKANVLIIKNLKNLNQVFGQLFLIERINIIIHFSQI